MTLILSALFFVAGGFFIFLAALGVYRMPDVYLKCHTASKASTLAKLFVFVGAAIYFLELAAFIKVFFIIAFFFFTVPVGTHLIARAAHKAKAKQSDKTLFDDYSSES